MLKPWYGCPIPENATKSDIYYEYSSGVLNRETTLLDQYQTASVVAISPGSHNQLIEHVPAAAKNKK